MAAQGIWGRLMAAIEREYERRVRAASLVKEYGAQHDGHGDIDDEGEAAVISNVPRGTPVRRGAGATERREGT